VETLSTSAEAAFEQCAGSAANSAVLTVSQIAAIIHDLDNSKHQSKIYEIIMKHQPELLSGFSGNCIDVSLLSRFIRSPRRTFTRARFCSS
jgi:hypothetical protein